MNWSQQRCLQPLLMFSYTSVNLIEVHWSHWNATTWWLACCDMCLISFSWDSVIYCTPTLVRAQLSQLGFWSMVNLSVDCGLHSVKLDSLIQFKWTPWEFKLICHSCLQHDHCIVLLILYVNIQSCYSFCSTITPFSCLIVINLLWDCVLVPRLLWQINSYPTSAHAQR